MQRTAMCPIGNHEFTYEVRPGTQPVYCSRLHASRMAYQRRQEKLEGVEERWCPKGNHMAPANEFSSAKAPYCKTHFAQYERERRAIQSDYDPLRARRNNLARYGLTPETFDAMLAAQGGKCAVCGTTSPGGTGRNGPRGWHVDHDHACCDTRKRSCGRCNRGILCSNCNVGIGNLHESREILLAAVSYLDLYRARRDAEGHTSS